MASVIITDGEIAASQPKEFEVASCAHQGHDGEAVEYSLRIGLPYEQIDFTTSSGEMHYLTIFGMQPDDMESLARAILKAAMRIEIRKAGP